MTDAHEEKIYTVGDVARILQVSERTVWRMLGDRSLKFFMARQSVRIRESALDALKSKEGDPLAIDKY